MRLRSRGTRRSFAPSGLWVAAVGFFVTRFTVTLAAHESRTQFLVAGVVPLVLGLLLAAFGVALFVGSFDRSLVRSVALWCTAGTLAMAAMVALTLLGTASDGTGAAGSAGTELVLSNFLIGGALLGALTGLYAGENRRARIELRQQANRLVAINRILRHEVLNAVAIVRGRAETIGAPDVSAPDGESLDAIVRESDRIVETVEEVKYLARSNGAGLSPVDLDVALAECVDTVQGDFPDVEFVREWDPDRLVEVWADGQLARALHPIVENAAAYDDSDDPTVAVDVDVGRRVARVRIADSGPGLPTGQRATLERGAITDFDDPAAGFGTNVARLFVESYGGDIRTEVTEGGTTVEVELALAAEDPPSTVEARSVRSIAPGRSQLLAATGAAVVAGGAMGLFVLRTAGVIPVIGSLYGVSDPLVGWIAHEFHSVVFGLIFAGLLTMLPSNYADRLAGTLGVAVAWSLVLWLVAAGLIMPVWLNLVGIPATLPSVSGTGLASHLVWGVTLGGLYHVGTSGWRGRRET